MLAEPKSPVCKTLRPIFVKSGRMYSKVARSHPEKILMFPVSALWQPPDTGQSTAAPPFSSTKAPNRLTSASSVVDISSQTFSAVTKSSICCITSLDALGLGKHVIMTLHASIIFCGFFPSLAPLDTRSSTKFASRS